MNPNFKKYLLEIKQASDCSKLEVIQSLWSGYGEIVRYQIENSDFKSVVVKSIILDKVSEHPRGWNTNLSHNRKVKSYEIETEWYEQWSQFCGLDCRIPKFLGSYSEDNQQWIVLEDLDLHYPARKHKTIFSETMVCLKWLAAFHATFMNKKPEGLWTVGTYWNLTTRPEEFEKIENKELKSKAHLIDDALNNCSFQTIVHGDAKLANFCFSEDGRSVAAVDFQYVGGGCGMKDVVYLLGSCLTSDECELYEEELLNFYFAELKSGLEDDSSFKAIEQEWRRMYPIASVDFTRFLMGWMPTHQKVNRYSTKILEDVIKSL